MCIGDRAIKMNFCIGYTDDGGADIFIGVKFITNECHTDSVDLSLIGLHGAKKVGISNFLTSWYLMGIDKKIVLLPYM